MKNKQKLGFFFSFFLVNNIKPGILSLNKGSRRKKYEPVLEEITEGHNVYLPNRILSSL